MPGLSDLEAHTPLAHSHICLTQTQESGSGNPGDTGIEIGLDLGSGLPALNLIAAHIKSQTGSEGGKTE